MISSYNAIIIGAGVIGACTAFELAKKGMKTLSIDKLPEAGYGSTSGSCAIIRTYYSTFETCAMAYEGWHYWKDWANDIGVDDDHGLIKYRETGCLVIKTPHNHSLAKVCAVMDEIGGPYQDLSIDDIHARLPIADTQRFTPAKRLEDPISGNQPARLLKGLCFFQMVVTSTTQSCPPIMFSELPKLMALNSCSIHKSAQSTKKMAAFQVLLFQTVAKLHHRW